MAHPSFVEIIKQLTPDEARLLKYFSTEVKLPMIDVLAESEDSSGSIDVIVNLSLFGKQAGCEHLHLTPTYLDNLSRLGLIEIPKAFYTAPNVYDELESHPSIVEAKKQINDMEGQKASIGRKLVNITQLGKQFINACVIDHREL